MSAENPSTCGIFWIFLPASSFSVNWVERDKRNVFNEFVIWFVPKKNTSTVREFENRLEMGKMDEKNIVQVMSLVILNSRS